MSNNQWVRLSGEGPGMNLLHARSITPLGSDKVLIIWACTGDEKILDGERAQRLRAWLAEQYLPPIAP